MYRSKRSSIPSIIEVSSEIFDEDEAQTSLPLALSTPEKMNEDALCIDEKKLKTICSPVTLKDLLGKIHIHTDSMSSSKAEESLLSCSLRDNSDAVFKSVPPSNVGTSVPKMVQILETNTEEEERDELDDIDNLLLQDCIRLSELLDSQVEDLEDDKRSICSTKDPMSKESINSTPTPTPTPIPSQANSDDSITSEASNNPLGLQYIRYYQTNQDNGVALIGREVQKRLIGDRWLPGKVTGYCKPFYEVTYEDGSQISDLLFHEIDKLLLPIPILESTQPLLGKRNSHDNDEVTESPMDTNGRKRQKSFSAQDCCFPSSTLQDLGKRRMSTRQIPSLK